MERKTIKQTADVERIVEVNRNQRTSNNPYTINDTVQNTDGTPLDKQERTAQLARSEWTKQKPYDTNSID